MANLEQLALLQRGVQVWNLWRQDNPQRLIDLRNAHLPGVDLCGANLQSANLCNADLRYANLQKASLRSAILSQTILRGSNLNEASCRYADLRKAYLSYASLRNSDLQKADLSETDLSDADLSNSRLNYTVLLNADLRRAYLSYARLHYASLYNSDLSDATLRFTDLYQADLRRSNLSYADLSGANLTEVRALNTTFFSAIMTGVCIEGWHIGRRTILDKVKCRYLFRQFDLKQRIFLQRQPEDSETIFSPGEFAFQFQVLQNLLSIVELTFSGEIDWQAFLVAFQELCEERTDEIINIRGIERKGETFIVRLEVDAEADKAAIKIRFEQVYKERLKEYEDSYQQSGSYKPQDLASFRRKQASIPDIIQTMASIDWFRQNGHQSSTVSSLEHTTVGSDLLYLDQQANDQILDQQADDQIGDL